MKRPIHATMAALALLITLLIPACAPAPYMVATLTQLPMAGTPPTHTPYPTVTPRFTRTPTPQPTAVDAAKAELTRTSTVLAVTPSVTVEPTRDATIAAMLTQAAAPAGTMTPSASCPSFDTALPSPNTPQQYIGKHYNSIKPPAGIKDWSGGLLEDNSYSWAHVMVQSQDMYWIQKMVCRDTSGVAYWEIVDALALPQMNAATHQVTTDLCFDGDQKIPFAVAYGTYDPSKPAAPVVGALVGWPIQVQKAWEMKDKFIPLDTQGLTCMLQEPQKTQ